jgi:O-antigen/teichoic acid export membrane protein
LAARHDKKRFEKLFFVYTKMVSIVTMPLCLALMFLSEPLVKLWVGPSFDTAGRLMPLHLLPLLAGIPLSVCGCVTNAYNKVRLPSQVGFVAGVFNVGLGLALGVWKGYWLYGMAAASSITLFLYLAIFTPYYSCRIAGIPFRRYVIDAWLKPFVWALGLIAAPLALAHRLGWEKHPAAAWLAFGALILAAYAAAVFRFVLTMDEKKKFFETASRFVPSPKQEVETSDPFVPKLGNK